MSSLKPATTMYQAAVEDTRFATLRAMDWYSSMIPALNHLLDRTTTPLRTCWPEVYRASAGTAQAVLHMLERGANE